MTLSPSFNLFTRSFFLFSLSFFFSFSFSLSSFGRIFEFRRFHVTDVLGGGCFPGGKKSERARVRGQCLYWTRERESSRGISSGNLQDVAETQETDVPRCRCRCRRRRSRLVFSRRDTDRRKKTATMNGGG